MVDILAGMSTKGLALAIAAGVAATSWEARAGQLVVMDETWVHAPELADSHYRVIPTGEVPTDWTSPIDWTKGSVWVHLEVLSKPTAQETKFQVCFEANPTYACTLQSPTYTEIGIYEWESTFAQFWSPPNQFVDWKQGVNKFACILKDTMNGKPSADNVGPETAALYMPTEVRMVITLVEPGSTYEPPAPLGEETTGGESTTGETSGETTGEPGTSTSDTGGEATTGEATSTGLPTTTGEGTSGESTTSTSDSDSTSEISGADSLPSEAPDTTTSDGTSAGDGATDTGKEGCGCRGGGDGAGVFGLVIAGLARRRRRR